MGGTREEIRELLAAVPRAGLQAHRRAARRPALRHGAHAAISATHPTWSHSSASEHDGYFHIEVGCYPEMHPQADDALADLRHFKAKVDAGADGAITQYFYNADAYFRFVDDVRRLGVRGADRAGHHADLELHASSGVFPTPAARRSRAGSAKRMQAYGDDAEAIREFAAEIVADMCRRLIDGGAPALHFYTLNLSKPTLNVLRAIEVRGSVPRARITHCADNAPANHPRTTSDACRVRP